MCFANVDKTSTAELGAWELVDGEFVFTGATLPRGRMERTMYSASLGKTVGVRKQYDEASRQDRLELWTWDGTEFESLPCPADAAAASDLKLCLAPVPAAVGDVALIWASGWGEAKVEILSNGEWTTQESSGGLGRCPSRAASQLGSDGAAVLAAVLLTGKYANSLIATWDGTAAVERVGTYRTPTAISSGTDAVLVAKDGVVELRSAEGSIEHKCPRLERGSFSAVPGGFVAMTRSAVLRVTAEGVEQTPTTLPFEALVQVATSGLDDQAHFIGYSTVKRKTAYFDATFDGECWTTTSLDVSPVSLHAVTARLPDGYAIVQADKGKPIKPMVAFVGADGVDEYPLTVSGYKGDDFRQLRCAFYDAPTDRLYLVLMGKRELVLAGHVEDGKFDILALLDPELNPIPGSKNDPWANFRQTVFGYRAADRTLLAEGPVDDQTGAEYTFELSLSAFLDAQ